jgi:hypothetical protein
MTINWTQLYLDTHQFSEGAITIASSFVGNILAIKAQTKPEYATTRQIIGYIFQQSGSARKGYALYSGDDVLLLALPETSGLTFFPTSFLSDSYTLEIAYTSVGNILEPNTAPIPDDILALVSRVNNLESNAIAPAWENITGKPESFAPSSHNHAISEVTGLTDALAGKSNTGHTHAIADISYLSDTLSNLAGDITTLEGRVTTLEAASPTSGASLNYTPISTDTDLEVNQSYLAEVGDLVCTLPSSATVGDIINLSTGNFSLKIRHGDSVQSILNNLTLTTTGADNGIVLKPYADVSLMYLGSNLWKTVYRARTVNNFTPLSLESTATLKSYTASSSNLSNAYGTALSDIYDGVKTVGALTNGFLSDNTSGGILITCSEPIILESLKLWNGQGNVGAGGSSGYRVNDMVVYAGSNTSGENLGSLTFTDTTATEQSKTLTPNTNPSTQFFLQVNGSTPNVVGILELELYGKAATGGEVSV